MTTQTTNLSQAVGMLETIPRFSENADRLARELYRQLARGKPVGPESLAEALGVSADGVQELLIVAQDTAAYGVDLKYRTDFWEGRPLKTDIETLVRQLGQLGAWIRLHYIYPYPKVDKLVGLMAEGLVLPYLDIPLQHASPKILKAMRRPGDVGGILRRIEGWREMIPEIALRSTFIVGFPGETDEDFEMLLDFMREARLDRAGAFTYSPVEGAAANELGGAIPEELKQERLERFMEVQTAISADKLQQRVGNNYTIHALATAMDRLRSAGPETSPEMFLDLLRA